MLDIMKGVQSVLNSDFSKLEKMLGPTIPITLPNHIYFILISHLPKVHINFQNMFNPNVTVIHIIVVYTFSLCIMYLPTCIASSCTVLQNWKNTAERPLPFQACLKKILRKVNANCTISLNCTFLVSLCTLTYI